MSLRDELPSQQPTALFHAIKAVEHNDIASQVEAFLARGGKVSTIPFGVSVDNMGRHHIRNEFTGVADYQTRTSPTERRKVVRNRGLEHFPKNRSKARSVYGQNIHARGNAGNKYFVVIVGNETYGTGEFWTLDKAKKRRDSIREARDLPPAEY